LKIPKLRWIIAALLFFATAINYADRLALSVVSSDLRHEFGMTEQDYSHVITMFFIAYAIMYACSGYIADRLGTRWGFSLFVLVWSAGAMLHALARGKWSLAACRFVLGAGEPGAWPAAAKAVAEWFPAHQRALGVGLFNAGSSTGSMLAPPMIAFLTLRYNWRVAFLFTGALGLLWMAAWLLLYWPPHRNRWLRPEEYEELRGHVRPPEETEPVAAGVVNWRRLFSLRQCYTLILVRFFTDPVIYFVIFWLPEYLRKERGFDLAMVGKYAWVPFLFGDIGYILGGWLSGRLIRAGWPLPKARKSVMLMGAAVMPVAIVAPLVPAAWMAIAAACFLTFGHALWIANLQTLPTDLFPGQEVATVSGFSGMGGAVGGILANLGTGYLVQTFSYAPVFALAGIVHPFSIGLVYLLLPDSSFERWAENRNAAAHRAH
jgi:MFS transporter, ACS family, hexuronate transporter